MTTASVMPTASIRSIHVGRPQTRGSVDAWTSAIYKTSVAGAVRLTTLGLDGDGQADPVNHGGPDKAVCVYSFDNYAFWIEQLHLGALPPSAFGENFTVQGVAEPTICIGDVLAVGTAAVVQVSQPRQPCWKLARKWSIEDFPEQVVLANRTGWYFRVVSEGTVQAGDSIMLVERPHPEWTVAAANEVMYGGGGHDRDASAALAAVPFLSKSWKDTLHRRMHR